MTTSTVSPDVKVWLDERARWMDRRADRLRGAIEDHLRAMQRTGAPQGLLMMGPYAEKVAHEAAWWVGTIERSIEELEALADVFRDLRDDGHATPGRRMRGSSLKASATTRYAAAFRAGGAAPPASSSAAAFSPPPPTPDGATGDPV